MRRSLLIAVISAFLVQSSSASNASSCDRRCLANLLDVYFQSVARHDATLVPTRAEVRITENAVESKLGEGVWRHGGAAAYRLDAVDEETGEIAANAVISYDDAKAILFVRLKILRKKVAEIESIVIHNDMGQIFNANDFSGRSTLYDTTISPKQRDTRSELEKAAQSYFDAVANAGTPEYKSPPVTKETARIENGMHCGPPAGSPMARSMDEQLRGGFGNDKLRVTNIRYPILDQPRGIVVAIGIMSVDEGPATEAAHIAPPKCLHPVDVPHRKQLLVEFFKINDHAIRQIQATLLDLNDPTHIATGWDH